jgi:uncharacterized protein
MPDNCVSMYNYIKEKVMSKNVFIVHHNDFDGWCSAAIAYRALKDREPVLIEANYGSEPDMKQFEGQELYILDFSFDPKIIKDLISKDTRVIWIDHHKTAITKMIDAGFIDKDDHSNWVPELEGMISEEKDQLAGCALTWFYFNDEFAFQKDKLPEAIKLISAFDVWVKEDKERIDTFIAGLYTLDLQDPKSNDWDKLILNNTGHWVGKSPISEVLRAGKSIIQFRTKFAEEYCEKYAFEAKFEGYKVLACGLSNMGSFAFGERSQNYDFVMSFEFDGDKWCYGLYQGKAKVDLGKIAQKYGGGGHMGAAGFSTGNFILNT